MKCPRCKTGGYLELFSSVECQNQDCYLFPCYTRELSGSPEKPLPMGGGNAIDSIVSSVENLKARAAKLGWVVRQCPDRLGYEILGREETRIIVDALRRLVSRIKERHPLVDEITGEDPPWKYKATNRAIGG